MRRIVQIDPRHVRAALEAGRPLYVDYGPDHFKVFVGEPGDKGVKK